MDTPKLPGRRDKEPDSGGSGSSGQGRFGSAARPTRSGSKRGANRSPSGAGSSDSATSSKSSSRSEASGSQKPPGSSTSRSQQARSAVKDTADAARAASGDVTAQLRLAKKYGPKVALALLGFVGLIMFGMFAGGDELLGFAPPDEEQTFDIPEAYLDAYLQAAVAYKVPWPVLAGLGSAATEHGRNGPHDLSDYGRQVDRDPERTVTPPSALAGSITAGTLAGNAGQPLVVVPDQPTDDLGPVGVNLCDERGCGPRPVIGADPLRAQGPVLLHPAADETPHDVSAAVMAAASALSERRFDLLSGPDADLYDGWLTDPEAADRLWADAVDSLGDVLIPPSVETLGCGLPVQDPTTVALVGRWVSAIWICELTTAALSDGLTMVTGVSGSGSGTTWQTTRKLDAVAPLVSEALVVSYAHSQWDPERCDIFPSLNGDCQDLQTNIREAAQAFAKIESQTPTDRPGSSNWQKAAGGWTAIPRSLGNDETRQRLYRNGPAAALQVPPSCVTLVRSQLAVQARRAANDWIAYLELAAPPAGRVPELERLLATMSFDQTRTDVRCAPVSHLSDDAWRREVTDIASSYQLEIAQMLLATSGFSSEEPDDSPVTGRASGSDAFRSIVGFEDLDPAERTRVGRSITGLSSYLSRTTSATNQPTVGVHSVVARLSPDALRPLAIPAQATALLSTGTSGYGQKVVNRAIFYGGTIPSDERVGQMYGGMAGALPTCGGDPSTGGLPAGATPQMVAHAIYETFYCNAAAGGLDQQAAPSSQYGFKNKAQQVASEAIVVGWCESIGFQAATSTNAYGYTGVFQMGAWETKTYIPGGDAKNTHANIVGAARYFMTQVGTNKWDGWGPWAVVNTDFATTRASNGSMPNYHVRYPVLHRFASTHPETRGSFNPVGLPGWALNPYQDAFPATFGAAGGCPVTKGQPWAEIPGLLSALPADLPAGALPSVGGVMCPIPGVRFINDWGFPRSGGRTHKGTDMFAPNGTPIYAPVDGKIVTNGYQSLGGWSVGLTAASGAYFYFTHNLGPSPFQIGDQVTQGTVIAQVSNTGNARTTPPHAHAEIHPGGRGGGATNPFPIYSPACPGHK
jgi:hypothetical protein